jgi:hypothetical protein
VTLPDGNQPEDMAQLYSALACDDTYVYIHSPAQGLLKLGSGFGDSVRGHVYAQNASYRSADTRRSLAWCNGKLFYTSPQLSGPKHDHQTKVAILNTDTLLEESVVTLPFPGDPEWNVLMSDGRHLFLVMQQEVPDEKKAKDAKEKEKDKEKEKSKPKHKLKQKGKEKKEKANLSFESIYDPTFVHIFDYSPADGVVKRKSLKLGACVSDDAAPSVFQGMQLNSSTWLFFALIFLLHRAPSLYGLLRTRHNVYHRPSTRGAFASPGR